MSEASVVRSGYHFDTLEALAEWLQRNPAAVRERIIHLCRYKQFDKADDLAAIAIRLYPDDRQIWLQYGLAALQRPDAAAAATRFEAIRNRFPDWADGYSYGGMALRLSGRIDDAEALLEHAMAAFTEDWLSVVEYAECAMSRGGGQTSIHRWEVVRQRFPDRPEGYTKLTAALARVGEFGRATEVIDAGFAHLPNDPQVLWHWAADADRRRDWQEALRRWRLARARHPDKQHFGNRESGTLLAIQLDSVDGVVSSAVAQQPTAIAGHDAELQRLLMRFEGMGNNCEFGIVQRSAGIEPLGLLRWATVGHLNLTQMLNSHFDGVGEADNTRVYVNQFDEYALEDTRYFLTHTFISAGQATREEVLHRMLRRLRFLKDKLIEDLTNGEKIFVYKVSAGSLDANEMLALLAAIRCYGSGTLFCVQRPTVPDQDNRVEMVADGLIVGYLSKLTSVPAASRDYFAEWVALCRAAERLASSAAAE